MRRFLVLSLFTSACLQAAQFTTTNDIQGGSPFFGPGPILGNVSDGGFDAFDGFGYYPAGIPAGFTLSRRVELLPGNLYRWVDTITNTSLTAATANLVFFGDLGSDSNTVFNSVTSHYQVSSEGPFAFDPVVGFIWGNNAFAATFSRTISGSDGISIGIPLSLAPGESKSLMFYAFLARELVGRVVASDVALATAQMNQLFANPDYSGLTLAEQNSIVNWGASVPEPSTWATLGAGLVLAAWRGRRRA